MDGIVTIVKNWLNDPHANCKPNSNFKQYLKIRKYLAKDNYNLVEKRVVFMNCELLFGLGLCGVWLE
jgi:hypothetical protein